MKENEKSAEKPPVDKSARRSRTVQMVAASNIRYNTVNPDGRKLARVTVAAGEPIPEDMPDAAFDQAKAAGQLTDADAFEAAQQKQAEESGLVEKK